MCSIAFGISHIGLALFLSEHKYRRKSLTMSNRAVKFPVKKTNVHTESRVGGVTGGASVQHVWALMREKQAETNACGRLATTKTHRSV